MSAGWESKRAVDAIIRYDYDYLVNSKEYPGTDQVEIISPSTKAQASYALERYHCRICRRPVPSGRGHWFSSIYSTKKGNPLTPLHLSMQFASTLTVRTRLPKSPSINPPRRKGSRISE
jgi:hypothetical protein